MADKKIRIHLAASANLKAVNDANASLVQMARVAGTTNKAMSAASLRTNAAFTEIANEADKAAARHVRSAKEIQDAWQKAWRDIKPKPQEANNAVKPLVDANKSAAKAATTSWLDEFKRGAIWKIAADSVSRVFAGIKNTITSAFSEAFRYEKQTIYFKTLIGDIDEARRHMADLKALGETPPFSLDQFAAASRQLMVMTDGVLGYKKSLEMIGDAAAATGRPIEEMGHAVGRLYAFIRDGEPLSRAVMELRNMGVLTPEVARKLQDMQNAGESGVAIWGEVEAALGRYSGAMKELEGTGEGLMGAIKSQWQNIVRAFGQAMENDAKGGMKSVLETAKELQEDGSIETWATTAASALGAIAKAVGAVVGGLARVMEHLNAGRKAWKELWGGESGNEADDETFELDREEEVNPYTKKRYFTGSNGGERVEVVEDVEKKNEHEQRLREIEEEERMRAALEEGDRRKAERAAEEQARKDAETQAKDAEKRARAEAKAAEAAAKERDRLDRELHAKRMADLRAEIAAQKEAASPFRAAAASAATEFERAFAMYRDPSRAAAEIGEEKDRAEDLERLHRDASRYGGKWRIDELSQLMAAGDSQGVDSRLAEWRKSRSFSPEVEAMVRASAAEQTRTTVEDELRKIEKNTGDLAAKLEDLISMKGG